LEQVAEEYPDFSVWVTPAAPVKFEIMETLTSRHGIVPERIVNFEPYTKRRYCEYAEQNIVLEKSNILLCCETRESLPISLPYSNMSSEEIYGEYLEMRKKTIESLALGNDGVCKGCDKIKDAYYSLISDDVNIRQLAFGAGFVCQFKCIYCEHIQQPLETRQKETNRMIEFVRWMQDKRIINNETRITIANGEITINPRFKEILELFSQNPCAILTNGMIYRQEIANMLRSERNNLNVSLDSGTPETFRKVKGVDCYDEVCDNITKYAEYAHEGSVNLKYILIPGINDRNEDIDGFLRICNEINATVTLSRDLFGKENFDTNVDSALCSAVRLISGARKAGLCATVVSFFYDGPYKDRISAALDEVLA
jgi:pyruvate-formate lyase-activating enzyme